MSSHPESLVRFRTELEEAIRRELGAEATASSNGWGARVLRAVRMRPGRTTLAVVAGVGVAASALFVGSPWKSSPGFSLERAQAALTPPKGRILRATWNVMRTSPDYGCTVTVGPNELWADLSPVKRSRIIWRGGPTPDALDRRSMACGESVTIEIGATRYETLRFVPPDTLAYFGSGLDEGIGPENLREALPAGKAHDEGQTELDGRIVERIRVDWPLRYLPVYCYVDRETFRPVQFECLKCLTFSSRRFGPLRFDIVHRYLTYEYLPRTAANIALTDIRAQHPDATGP